MTIENLISSTELAGDGSASAATINLNMPDQNRFVFSGRHFPGQIAMGDFLGVIAVAMQVDLKMSHQFESVCR